MYLVSSSEMKGIEKRTIEEFGVSSSILMENAGISVVDALKAETGGVLMKRVCVFCGQGNNGGDGFVTARHLRCDGASVTVFFTGDRQKLSPESASNLDAAIKYGVEVILLNSDEVLEAAAGAVFSCDIIIDALLGTGLNRPVEGFMAKVITLINGAGRYTVSVDVPSGLNSDTGDCAPVCVYADLTVTFGLPKKGLAVFPGFDTVGKLVVSDISFPVRLLSEPRKNVLVTHDIAVSMLPYRPKNANKGTFGPVLVIGGCRGMGGAPALSARGALKSGAGIVTIAAPGSLHDSVKAGFEEVLFAWLKEDSDGFISGESLERLLELSTKAKTAVIGPGLGSGAQARVLAREFIMRSKLPVIIDADAINAVSEDKNCLKNLNKDVILTPHLGEMSKLCDAGIVDIVKNKFNIAADFARKYGVNVLLKDGRSIIADRDGNIYVNTTGNSGMATPGSGDVLSGVIASFAAQGMNTLQAGIAANYVHGLSGDLLLAEMSGEGITAGDIAMNLAKAIKTLKI